MDAGKHGHDSSDLMQFNQYFDEKRLQRCDLSASGKKKLTYCVVVDCGSEVQCSTPPGCTIGITNGHVRKVESHKDESKDGIIEVEVEDIVADVSASSRRKTHKYTAILLSQSLQFLGCKPRRADKVCRKVFFILEQRMEISREDSSHGLLESVVEMCPGIYAVFVSRTAFEKLVLFCLGDHPSLLDKTTKYVYLSVACSIQERRDSVAIVLCGTSGTGKSTLASLLAARLGITCVMSTDAIRHMLRGFHSKLEIPSLWKSTYETADAGCADSDKMLRVYQEQKEAILPYVEKLISSYHRKKVSIVIEGVHLDPRFIIKMMKKYTTVVPFFLYISNEAKHMERFAVRAKAMTLKPESNRYVKHLDSIRYIQNHLQTTASECRLPMVDNTNVDRSLAAIHATVLCSLRRRYDGQHWLDANESSCGPILHDFQDSIRTFWSSTAILRQIQGKTGKNGFSPATSVTSTTGTVGQDKVLNLAELQSCDDMLDAMSCFDDDSTHTHENDVLEEENLVVLSGDPKELPKGLGDLGSIMDTEVGSEEEAD